ncbi:MAG: DEAD/DEAH box helicase family protein [Betaproteobacteria bacterium AqS2]|uniref:DEAD/DEAH box helicase family protein n=1 Tax=Candidatus Amphirhobacter heronislandensis TaxID=1732024 RepID=A0A930XXK3_9GAMM|nr:DEAD/DEAH box helicase family protein [Betaproteobacteria bacterium AqS2]
MLFEKLEYQRQCVDNIVKALAGCDFAGCDFSPMVENLKELEVPFPSEINPRKNQIDVLMETGTGKTFTYLKTIFELHRLFGQNKFIIVLPRVAIKLGVIQNIRLTKEYFYNEYQRHLDFINYPKDGLDCIHNDFINSSRLSVIITTNSAFNSKDRRINKQDENLLGMRSTWEGIANKKPVVIIDEPHLLKGSETKRGLAKLDKSLFIRFGATFPTDSENSIANLAYALDSKAAFDNRLVKKIGVSTVFDANEMSNIEVKNIVRGDSFDPSSAKVMS